MKEIGITSSSTQLGINGGMKSCSLVTNIGMSFLADKMGRRPMYLISVSKSITGRNTPYGISTSREVFRLHLSRYRVLDSTLSWNRRRFGPLPRSWSYTSFFHTGNMLIRLLRYRLLARLLYLTSLRSLPLATPPLLSRVWVGHSLRCCLCMDSSTTSSMT
jgi:hypothetical protein